MFLFFKKTATAAAEVAALRRQLETAKRRITDLTLENIQQANEIMTLQQYGVVREVEFPRPVVMIGKDMTIPAAPANSEIGLLHAAMG